MHGKEVKFLQKGIVCLQQFEYKLRLCIISLQERNPLQVLLHKILMLFQKKINGFLIFTKFC